MTVNLSLADWDCPEFAKLPLDFDLLAEWAEHNEARTAARHPDQPVYDAQYATPPAADRLSDG